MQRVGDSRQLRRSRRGGRRSSRAARVAAAAAAAAASQSLDVIQFEIAAAAAKQRLTPVAATVAAHSRYGDNRRRLCCSRRRAAIGVDQRRARGAVCSRLFDARRCRRSAAAARQRPPPAAAATQRAAAALRSGASNVCSADLPATSTVGQLDLLAAQRAEPLEFSQPSRVQHARRGRAQRGRGRAQRGRGRAQRGRSLKLAPISHSANRLLPRHLHTNLEYLCEQIATNFELNKKKTVKERGQRTKMGGAFFDYRSRTKVDSMRTGARRRMRRQ